MLVQDRVDRCKDVWNSSDGVGALYTRVVGRELGIYNKIVRRQCWSGSFVHNME